MTQTDDRLPPPDPGFEKERVVRPDGRYVIFYRWPERPGELRPDEDSDAVDAEALETAPSTPKPGERP